MQNLRTLTFEAVDQLGIAFAEGLFSANTALPYRFRANEIAPFIELLQLVDAGVIPPAVVQEGVDTELLREVAARLRAANPYWVCERSGQFGIMRLGNDYGDDEESRWAGFSIKAKKAAESMAFPSALAGQFVGVVKELHSNVYEHSEHSHTGFVAFSARDGLFEVVVSDCGIGVLQSLRLNPKHVNLASDAEALRLALQPGVSRFSDQHDQRGHGFDQVYTGMLNHNTALRFRSGTGAVTIDGCSSGNPKPMVRERARIPGFLIAITCRAAGSATPVGTRGP